MGQHLHLLLMPTLNSRKKIANSQQIIMLPILLIVVTLLTILKVQTPLRKKVKVLLKTLKLRTDNLRRMLLLKMP